MKNAWRGRRALVTGGSSGIGRATARLLVRAGAHVAVAARREAPLAETCEGLRREARDDGRRIAWCSVDVTDERSAAEGVARGAAALGGLDLLVNSAGAAHAGRFEDTPPQTFRHLLDVNLLGLVHVTRAALPALLRQRGSHVANVSSFAGLLAVYGYTAYAASKYAVTGFSEALRQELRPQGLGVSIVFPPDTDTPQLAHENRDKPAVTRALAGAIPVMQPEEVAEALLQGVARRRFWIVPGRRARLLATASRLFPGLARRSLDRDIARALGRAIPATGRDDGEG